MPTSSNSYGTSSDMSAMVGDIVVSRTFSTTSTPTLAQVEFIIDGVAADLNRELQAAGVNVPVTTGDQVARQFLVHVNNAGAAAQVLAMLPVSAVAPGMEEAGANRQVLYMNIYLRGVESIKQNRVVASRSRRRLRPVFAGSQQDSDGNRKKPLFHRGLTDYPSTRSLTE